MADIGSEEEAGELFDMALDDASQRPALLKALLAMSARGCPPPKDSRRLERILAEPEAQRLSGQWKIVEVRPRLIEIAADANTSDANRAAAVDGLAKLGGSESIDALKKLSSAPTSHRRAPNRPPRAGATGRAFRRTLCGPVDRVGRQ